MNKLQKSILAVLPFFAVFLFLSQCGQIEQNQGLESSWQSARTLHLKSEPVCQACGRDETLEVHHILPLSWGGKRCDPENLITLCDRCHLLVGHLNDNQSYNPDVKQDAKDWRKKIENRPRK